MPSHNPAIEENKIKSLGGGSLLIAWQLKDKRVLIVGGGEIAAQRIESILHTDADISVLAPNNGLHPRTKLLIDLRKDRISYIDRSLQSAEDLGLDGIDMVLTALDDATLSGNIVALCRAVRIPVNAADLPDLCDFYFGAQLRDGPLQIVFSTNGNGPRMAALVRDRVQNALSGYEGEAITKVGILRGKLKERAPGVGGKIGKERMRWMTGLCDAWKMEDLAALDENMMQRLIEEGWEKERKVITAEELGLRQPKKLPEWTTTSWNETHAIPTSAAFVLGAITATILLALRRKI